MEVVATIKALTLGAQAVNTAIKLNNSNEATLKASELIDRITETQTAVLELLQKNIQLVSRNNDLEKEIASLLASKSQKEMYTLIPYGKNEVLIYKHKETKHLVCPLCFENDKIRTLQDKGIGFVCNQCATYYSHTPMDTTPPQRW